MDLAKQLPPKVVSVLGQEATEELLDWLTHRMQTMVGTGVNTIRLSSFTARQKVNVLMLDNVSNLLISGEPRLLTTEEERIVWRVPVDLSYSERGRVGCVGEVDVDARFGIIYYDDALLARIETATKELALQVLTPTTASALS